MKSRILDISDCFESPLLAGSRSRRKMNRRSPTDLFHTRRGYYHQGRRSNIISMLTEANLGAAISESEKPVALPKLETENISYQARCAERWWAEFSRWFGQLKNLE